MPNKLSQSDTLLSNHSTEEAEPKTSPDQSNGLSSKDPPLLRELDTELLQSGKLMLTGMFQVYPFCTCSSSPCSSTFLSRKHCLKLLFFFTSSLTSSSSLSAPPQVRWTGWGGVWLSRKPTPRRRVTTERKWHASCPAITGSRGNFSLHAPTHTHCLVSGHGGNI